MGNSDDSSLHPSWEALDPYCTTSRNVFTFNQDKSPQPGESCCKTRLFGDLPSFSTCTEKESNLKYHLVEAKRFAKRQTRTPHLIHDDFKSAFNYKFMVPICYGVVYWVHLILGLEVSFRAAV